MSDQNLYVQAYQKNPGALATDGLRAFYEVSLGVQATPTIVAAASLLTFSSVVRRPVYGLTLTFAAYSLAMTDAGAAGSQGSVKLLTLPAKAHLILPTVVALTTVQAALGSSSGIVTGAAVVGSLGSATAGVNNATLTSTEADVVASTACTLTAYVGAFSANGPVPFIQDGSAGAKSIWLNFAVPDADSAGNDNLLLTGTIDLSWQQLN